MKDLADLIELRHGLPTFLNTPSAKIVIERNNLLIKNPYTSLKVFSDVQGTFYVQKNAHWFCL